MQDPASATVLVAAAIVIEQGRVLISQRKRGSHLEGAWEFPGGKVEPGEDPRDALVRELREEVGIEVAVGDIVEVTFHRYPGKAVLLLFYAALRLPDSPDPEPIDVADVRWAARDELEDELFPAADVPVLGKVRRMLWAG
jgi:8-oxo-dGTP diphosphatase